MVIKYGIAFCKIGFVCVGAIFLLLCCFLAYRNDWPVMHSLFSRIQQNNGIRTQIERKMQRKTEMRQQENKKRIKQKQMKTLLKMRRIYLYSMRPLYSACCRYILVTILISFSVRSLLVDQVFVVRYCIWLVFVVVFFFKCRLNIKNSTNFRWDFHGGLIKIGYSWSDNIL